MAGTLVDSTTTGNTAFASSRAPGVPTGAGAVLLNDIAVVRISRWESTNPAFTNISGFTQRTQAVNGSGKIDTFIKRMAGGETGTWTFAWTGSMWTTAHAMLYRGIDPLGSLSDNAIFKLVSATNSGANFPVVNAGSVGAGVLDWHGYSESTSPGHTAPASWTKTEDNDSDVNAWRAVTAGSYSTAASAAGVSSNNIASLLFLPEASGGASLTLGLITETDSAPALTRQKIRVVGLVSESDTTPAMGRSKSANLGLPTETDLSSALSPSKARNLGLIAESDLALSLTPQKTRALGLATETSQPLPVSRSKSASFGLTAETDQALALAPQKIGSLGLITESDTTAPLAPAKAKTLGLATETDTTFVIGRSKSKVFGLPFETDMTHPMVIEGGVARILGLVTELGTVPPIGRTKSLTLGLITEMETVPTLGLTKLVELGLVTETDLTFALAAVKSLALGLPLETEVVFELDIETGGPGPESPQLMVTKNGTGVAIARIGVVRNGLFVEATSWVVNDA
jgi:hypothetical protein